VPKQKTKPPSADLRRRIKKALKVSAAAIRKAVKS